MKKALITGITGQDGFHLSVLLLGKGYEVHGTDLRSAVDSAPACFSELHPAAPGMLCLHRADVTDGPLMRDLAREIAPHEIYHLAARSYSGASFEDPGAVIETNGIGTLRVLEAAAALEDRPRVFNASSAVIFGNAPPPQDELTPLKPLNPYGCSKALAHDLTVAWREGRGLFACNGIMFNHESPLRPERFVTRKISLAAARIKAGLQDSVRLGNLDARRDWGFAGDFVEAMWLMLQQEKPSDFVIATGESRSVREFAAEALKAAGIADWESRIEVDPELVRPAEPAYLCGRPARALRELGWSPRTSFQALVKMMVEEDVKGVGRIPGTPH